MTTMYTAVQFPQANTAGFTYQPNAANPNLTNYGASIPATASLAGAVIPPNWNPYSSAAADRVQYLPDSAGTLTYGQVMIAAYGLNTLQTNQIKSIFTQMTKSLETGVPVTVNGVSYNISVLGNDLSSNLAKVAAANMVIAQAPEWAADTVYRANSIVKVANGVLLFSSKGGTSGATEPTAPSAFQTPVTDGTVEWALMGLFCATVGGTGLTWMTPQTLLTAFQSAVNYITDVETNAFALTEQVNAATTYEAIQAIQFSS